MSDYTFAVFHRYTCDCCGAGFDEPFEEHHRENLDGERGIWEYRASVCPFCGSADYHESEDENETDV